MNQWGNDAKAQRGKGKQAAGGLALTSIFESF